MNILCGVDEWYSNEQNQKKQTNKKWKWKYTYNDLLYFQSNIHLHNPTVLNTWYFCWNHSFQPNQFKYGTINIQSLSLRHNFFSFFFFFFSSLFFISSFCRSTEFLYSTEPYFIGKTGRKLFYSNKHIFGEKLFFFSSKSFPTVGMYAVHAASVWT